MKLWFTDFWEHFNMNNNIFIQVLSKHYSITLDQNNPDLLIYSCFGNNNQKYTCVKIYYCGENLPSQKGYSIDMNKVNNSSNHLYFPLYALNEYYDYRNIENLEYSKDLYNRELCSAVVSNTINNYRNKIVQQKWVNGAGYLFNKRIKNKIKFISQYKFNLAMENSNSYGYCTEKIVDAFLAKTIPIYWGNVIPPEDFNPESYIYLEQIDNIYEYITNMSENDYLKMLKAPKFSKSIPNYHLQLEQFLLKIIEENGISNSNCL